MAKLLDAFIEKVEAANYGVEAVVVMQHGEILEEYRVIPDEPHVLHSLSKSFTSVAFGKLIDEGKASLSDKVISYFPEYLPEVICDELAALTVRDLLVMAPGHGACMMMNQRAAIEGDWVRYYLAQPFDKAPGTKFEYDTGCTYIVGAIIQKITGQTVRDFLMPRLFAVLGIENPLWETCPSGRSVAGAGLWLRTEEIARFGQMLLNKGVYNGTRIVSEAYLKEATSKQIENAVAGAGHDNCAGYGYQFWMNENGTYRGDGAYAQFCIVDEEKDAVIAINSQSNQAQEILDAVWEELRPLL